MEAPEAGELVAMNILTDLQATLEKAMCEMPQVSSILQDLQEDVSVVKTSQAKMETDVTNHDDKLEQAGAQIMDLEAENVQLDK